MFRQSFQGCPYLMLLEAKGAQPMKDWDTRKANCARLYNKDVKTYVVDLTGQSNQTIKVPRDGRNLGITQQYLGFQMFLPKDSPFSITVTIETGSRVKIRFVLSTSVKYVKVSTLHARIPLHMVAGTWTTLIVDLFELSHMFPHQEYSQLVSIELSPYATFMRVFTLLNCPLPTLELYSELDLQDHMRNPRLPPFKFSKRVHKPLDSRLQAVPMHIQIIDAFYVSLFDETKVHHDIAVRDVAQIVEARRVFMDAFNQFDQYEQMGVKITKTEVLQVGEMDEEQLTAVYRQQEELAVEQRAQRSQQRREREQRDQRWQERGLRQRQRAAAALEQLKVQQTEVAQQRREIEGQLQQLRAREQSRDASAVDVVRGRQNQAGTGPQARSAVGPPQVLQTRNEDDSYCAQNVDLTLNAVPVQIHTLDTGGVSTDQRSVSPVVPQYGVPVGQLSGAGTPKPLRHSDNTAAPQAIADTGLSRTAEQRELDIQGEEDVRNNTAVEGDADTQKKDTQNVEEDYDDHAAVGASGGPEQPFGAAVEYRTPADKPQTAVQLIPDPDEAMQEPSDRVPDPAEIQHDPVAYGLVYDPATGCYYEADD